MGDSRAYLVRDGTIERITTDHSLVEELIQAGELTEEEAERDPRRSMITRALGLEPGVAVDVESVDLRAGDRLLLCSDGLTTMVSEGEIAALVSDEDDPHVAASTLVEAANDAGGADNITVVIIDIEDSEDDDTPPPDSAAEPEPEPETEPEPGNDDETVVGETIVDEAVVEEPGANDDDESEADDTKPRRGLGRLFGRGK